MGLSWALPWMLGGLALLALPVFAHLTGYREVRTVEFPTLRFLRASEFKVRRRRRLESLLLLLLRGLAVAGVVMLFARPSLTWTATALAGLDPTRTTVVLIDTSASMSASDAGQTVFDEARSEAASLLDGLVDGTLAAVITFDGSAAVVPPGLTAERERLTRALDDLEMGAGRTDLDRALRRARELLRDSAVGSANVFVLSDGTATELPAGLADSWPAEVTVHYHDLLGERRTNRFVTDATVRGGLKRGEGIRVEVEARAVGPRPTRGVPLTLGLEDGVEVVSDLEFDESGEASRSFSLPLPPSGQRRATLTVPTDGVPADDAWPLVLEGDSDLSVLLVSGDGGANPRDDEVWYLEKALQPGPGSPSRIRPRVVKAEELRSIAGGAGDVVFLCNVADPRPLVSELEGFVKRGGGLFISVGARVDPDLYNDALGSLLPADFTEIKTRGRGTFEEAPMGLSLPPMEQDVFRVFRTGGAGVFARVGFGKVMGTAPRLKADSDVLLRYTDGLPALLDRRVGEGRVLVLTSSVDDDWTDLPVRSIFVSLAHQIARSLSGTLLLEGAEGLEVGSRVSLPVPPDLERRAWVTGPDGYEHTLDPGSADAEGRAPFAQTAIPGHYRLFWEDRSGREPDGRLRAVFSVRVPLDESILVPADRDLLLDAVPGLVHHGGGASVAAEEPGKVVRTASLAPAMLLLLALAMLGEVFLAGRRA
ncbi:MAG: VWA domain-containing protein [Proteobacteria bacterium]|nr:VWA domain-containing protein [Pseudomonadota bacterium]